MNFEDVADPLDEVDHFRRRAETAGLPLAEAMTLATVDSLHRPKARVVLLKGRSGRQLHFFTNYQSAKSTELAENPWAALCIHYPALALQARIEGQVSRLSQQQSDDYFTTRPRESQIGAWASKQSETLGSRAELDAAYEQTEERYRGRSVPRPPHWGGFGLTAERVELWVGREGRLHDRAVYTFVAEKWDCCRLQP